MEDLSTCLFVIDSPNVAWAWGGGSGGAQSGRRPPIMGLRICIEYFLRRRARGVVAFCPKFWSFPTGVEHDDSQMSELIASGLVFFAPSGSHDDTIFLQFSAQQQGSFGIVSNDLFRDHFATSSQYGFEWMRNRRIGYAFVGDAFVPDPEALRRALLPTIEVDLPPSATTSLVPPSSNTHHVSTSSSPSPTEVVFRVAPSRVGALIGPQGSTIKAVEQKSGATVRMTDDHPGVVHVTGPTQHAVEIAIALMDVKTRFIDLPDDVFIAGLPGPYPEYHRKVLRFPPPANFGRLIGHAGMIIDGIQIQTGAKVEVSLDATGTQVVVISANARDQLQRAMEEVKRVMEDGGSNVMSGNGRGDTSNNNRKIYAKPEVFAHPNPTTVRNDFDELDDAY